MPPAELELLPLSSHFTFGNSIRTTFPVRPAPTIVVFRANRISDNGVDITAWSAAESAAAIIAASIPVLRVFTRQRDPRKSHRTKSFAEIHMSRLENTHCTDPRNTVAEVWITANNRDDDSDRSILREDHQPPPAWGILQTQTVKVANQSAGSGGRNYSTSE